MTKVTTTAMVLMAAMGAYNANALSMDEMKQPGSAVTWYQDDASMKELDVADYLFNTYAKKDVSQAKIDQVEQCLNNTMKQEYADADASDRNAPSLLSLLRECKA